MSQRERDRQREHGTPERDREWNAEERDWRTRNYEGQAREGENRGSGGEIRPERSNDRGQYTNRDYISRDFGREDRYRDHQNTNRDFTHGGGHPLPEAAQTGPANSGRHTGRGPRSWQRSDERISEDVNEELTRSPDVDATEIEVSVSAGEVTLSGTVGDRYEKRQAEECAWRVASVKDVHNGIRIRRTP